MAQQPQKPQRSLWDREPADVANMPPVYTQEYAYKAPAQPQPTHLMTGGNGAPREVMISLWGVVQDVRQLAVVAVVA
ncbi:hypothetical protein BOTCAL_0003g00610 [Botryotinia calthae]|uniref:Uncharacterized protein n=1 Tax=Botryotinia calthae TaxID=38488 RepID=A0A4Y8DHP5_9HELO|nr:hypothetical protein BOTCAL_0003g00610 [Botryotinia calthae]